MLEAKEDRGEYVQALHDEPDIPPDLQIYFTAWTELHATRPSGMGVQAIPYSDLLAWVTLRGIHDLEDRQTFAFFVTGIDNHWVKWAREEAKRERERNKPNNGGKPRYRQR